jgi:hypothetical protein
MTPEKDLLVKMVLDSWNGRIKQTDRMLAELSDAQLLNHVAPNKNRGFYLLAHLTATHDKMFELLNLGEPLFPALHKPYYDGADKAITEIPVMGDLRHSWTAVNTKLATQFGDMKAGDWFHRHTAVSEADFAKEPHRNKLNIMISRSNHLSYHLGQMMLLKK